MKTKTQKESEEYSIDEFDYETGLDWRYMKKLRSDTKVRHWHLKVVTTETLEGEKPVYDNFCIAQVFSGMDNNGLSMGETLTGYHAKKSGRPEDLSKPLFVKAGIDWLNGVEYLFRILEGEDVSKLLLEER